MNRKKTFTALLSLSVGLLAGCVGKRLEPGGAYAPGGFVVTTNTGGVGETNFMPTAQADMAFYVADSSYDLAYSIIDGAFKFERDNRAALWRVSPSIKHTLDEIRPKALEIHKRWAAARQAYIANPVATGL